MKTLFEKMRDNRKVAEVAKMKREARFQKQREQSRMMQNSPGAWNAAAGADRGMRGWFGYSGDAGGQF